MTNWTLVHHRFAGWRAVRNDAATDDDVSPYCLYEADAAAWAETEWGPQRIAPPSITRDDLDEALSLMKHRRLTERQTRDALNLVTERARNLGFDVEQDTKRIIADVVARG